MQYVEKNYSLSLCVELWKLNKKQLLKNNCHCPSQPKGQTKTIMGRILARGGSLSGVLQEVA